MNPILPLDIYTPDVEPHVFNNRVYLYGSQDKRDGTRYCELDYICYSSPINDLINWRYEGIIYKKTQDPANLDGKHDLYAPDVVEVKGMYYLFYFLESIDHICVAKANNPVGPFEYYGYVRYPEGIDKTTLEHYPSSFDPSVLNDNGHIYLSFGFSYAGNIPGMGLTPQNTKGGYVVELEEDLLTMKTIPRLVVPGVNQGKGTSFEEHEFLEAASLRKYKDTYYFIYSTQAEHELCYATSKYPDKDFTYQGILISNAGKYTKEEPFLNNHANNHGSIVNINDDYYLFYHRHTYGKQYSRQVCMEKLALINGLFQSTYPTSSGIQDITKGSYPAAYACYVYNNPEGVYIPFSKTSMDSIFIKDETIVNIQHSTIVFRYISDVSKVTIELEGKFEGEVSLNGITQPLTSSVTFQLEPLNHATLTFTFNSKYPITFTQLTLE
ncbi:MAG: family 43 glycosylhydrolase [Erysipelotrichaceae bacterium]|nr:family 43 glycosylhydrolase [Erysipelotrichaceae bacterium]